MDEYVEEERFGHGHGLEEVEEGNDIDFQGPPEEFFALARCGNAEILRNLLASTNDFDINAADFGGNAAMHLACIGNHIDAAKVLIEFEASIHAEDANGKQCLEFLPNEDVREELRRYTYLCTEQGKQDLRQKHADKLKRQKEKTIFSAAFKGDTIEMQAIIEKTRGKAINQQDANGNTPVMFALMNNKLRAAKYIIDAGADVWIKNRYNLHALNYCNGPRIYNLIHQCWIDATPEARARVKAAEMAREHGERKLMGQADLYTKQAQAYRIQCIRHKFMTMRSIRRKLSELTIKVATAKGSKKAVKHILNEERLAEEARLAALEAERLRVLAVQRAAWEKEMLARENARLELVAQRERQAQEYAAEMQRRKKRSDELGKMISDRKATELKRQKEEAAYIAQLQLEADREEIGRLMTAKQPEDRKHLIDRAQRMRRALKKL